MLLSQPGYAVVLAVFAKDCSCNMILVRMLARNECKQIKPSKTPHLLIKTDSYFWLSLHLSFFKRRVQQLQSIFKLWLKNRLILHIPEAAEIPLCPCVKAWPPAETCSPTRPTFHGNSSPSQWTNAPTEPHTDRYTHKHTVHSGRRGCVWVRASLSDCYKHTHNRGSPMASAQTAKLCELRSLLFTPRDNNVSVLSLSVFSLFPSFSTPSPSFIPPSLAVPHLQDDHLRPLYHAPRGWARLADHDVWSIREEPALRSLHEGALPADGAGLQEPVECLHVLTPGPPLGTEVFKMLQGFKSLHAKQRSLQTLTDCLA